MSGDRELLELAASAAGINLWWDGDLPKELVHHWSGNPEDGGEERDYPWNPLADDGDALRLAVKMGLHIEQYRTIRAYKRAPGGFWINGCEPIGDDPCAATRRAITRAAAEIGRGMA